MRILRYALRRPVPGKPWASFALVPEQEVNSDHAFFDDIVAMVKHHGFDFVLIERDDRIVEQRPPEPE